MKTMFGRFVPTAAGGAGGAAPAIPIIATDTPRTIIRALSRLISPPITPDMSHPVGFRVSRAASTCPHRLSDLVACPAWSINPPSELLGSIRSPRPEEAHMTAMRLALPLASLVFSCGLARDDTLGDGPRPR